MLMTSDKVLTWKTTWDVDPNIQQSRADPAQKSPRGRQTFFSVEIYEEQRVQSIDHGSLGNLISGVIRYASCASRCSADLFRIKGSFLLQAHYNSDNCRIDTLLNPQIQLRNEGWWRGWDSLQLHNSQAKRYLRQCLWVTVSRSL